MEYLLELSVMNFDLRENPRLSEKIFEKTEKIIYYGEYH